MQLLGCGVPGPVLNVGTMCKRSANQNGRRSGQSEPHTEHWQVMIATRTPRRTRTAASLVGPTMGTTKEVQPTTMKSNCG